MTGGYTGRQLNPTGIVSTGFWQKCAARTASIIFQSYRSPVVGNRIGTTYFVPQAQLRATGWGREGLAEATIPIGRGR